MKNGEAWVEIVGSRTDITPGMSLRDLLRKLGGEDIWGKNPAVLAQLNGRRASLGEPLWGGEQIQLIRRSDPEAHSTLLRTLCHVMAAAAETVFPRQELFIDFSYGGGIYCELRRPEPVDQREMAELKVQMWRLVEKDLPLTPMEWPEWGNPIASLEDFKTIQAYSPYDNVTAQAYPHIFALAGLTDPRVTYWEPAKWVAKLREHTTSDNMILLKTNMEAGHGGASGRFEALREVALEYAFALKVAGRTD